MFNNMIGSRNTGQGLSKIHSMKEPRIAGVGSTADQLVVNSNNNSNMSTLQNQQSHHTQSSLIHSNDVIINMQKQ